MESIKIEDTKDWLDFETKSSTKVESSEYNPEKQKPQRKKLIQ